MHPSTLVTRLFWASLLVALAACGGGITTTPVAVTTAVPQTTLAFASLAGAPTTVSGASQSLALPAIPGLATVGGANGDHLTVTTSGAVTATVVLAGAASAGTSSGPPVMLSSSSRRSQSLGGISLTPLYYVGVTNIGATASTITFNSLSLGLPALPPGTAVGLAHYDPSRPQDGWVMDCAFGSSQVSLNGTNATFLPGGGNFAPTLYPGATLYFAPYAYPISITATPTAPPSLAPTTPSVAPPTSLTGTYIGSAQQTSPSSQPSQYLEVALTQTGTSLSGTMAVLPTSGGAGGTFGTVSGTVSGSTVSLSMTPNAGTGGCAGSISGTASGSLIAGTFSSPGCSNDNNVAEGGTFSIALQVASSLASISGTYSGTISQTGLGTGTMTMTTTQAGTVWSGTATVTWPAPYQSYGGTSTVVGFVSSATSGAFGVLNAASNCSPFGTLTIGGSGSTLIGSFSGVAPPGSNGCTGSGSFTLSH